MPRMQSEGSFTLTYRPDLERKCRRTPVEPTPEVWARYEAAKAGFAALEAYEHTEWGGPDYGTEVPEPTTTYEIEWLETRDEWLARLNEIVGES